MLDEQKEKSLAKELIDFLYEENFKRLSQENMEILANIYDKHKIKYMDQLTEHEIPKADSLIKLGYVMFIPIIFLLAREVKDIAFLIKKPEETISKLLQTIMNQSFDAILNSLEATTKQ